MDILDADGQADRALGDAGALQTFLVRLGVRGGRRVDNEGADVADVGEVGVEIEGVDKRPCLLACGGGIGGGEVEGEDRAGVLQAELFLRGVVRGGR